MSANRRLGAEDSATRAALLDAALQLLLEEGYAAVTSRKVAARAGLKPQLVHYYFRTMDDLFLALVQRGAEQNLERQAQALASSRPLRALWEVATDPAGAKLTMELASLANHRKAIRAEVARYAERFRNAQLDAVRRALATAGVDDKQMPPIAALLLMTGLGQMLGIEQSLGVTAGHRATRSFIEKAITLMEGDS
jgi:AcrR family transcriptional regulator